MKLVNWDMVSKRYGIFVHKQKETGCGRVFSVVWL